MTALVIYMAMIWIGWKIDAAAETIADAIAEAKE